MRFALAAVLVLAPSPLAAQTVDRDEDVGDAEGIVITAARTTLPPSALPLTVEIIDREALATQAAISGSVVDAVSTLTPSFSPTRQKLSGAGESLRGRSPLFAINGVPQSTPLRDGSRDGFTIDPFFVDRVELIFGSNALQGIGATGGIVNQVTVGAPTRDGLSGRALIQGTTDDFNDDSFGGKIAGLASYRAGRLDVTGGAAFEARGRFYDAQGRTIGVDGTQGDIQESDSWSLFGRAGYELGADTRLDVIASRFELTGNGELVAVPGNRATEVPTTSVEGVQPGEPPANRTESVSVTLTDNSLVGGVFLLQGFFNRSRDTFGGGTFAVFQDPLIQPRGLFDQSQNRSRKYGGKVSYERSMPGVEALNLIAGFDVLFDRTEQTLIATGRTWVPETDFRSLAPFGQANLRLLDGRLRLAGGLRYEDVRITIPTYTTLASYGGNRVDGGSPTFRDLLVNGGVIVEPVPGVRAYGSYAEGYTVPDVGRITRAVSTPGVDIDSFLDITPIVSNNREVGVEVKRGPVDASAAYFWSSSERGQFLTLVNDVFEVQRQRVEIQGLELNASVRTPVPGVALSVGYAHLTGRTDQDGDGRVDLDLDGANISPDRLNLAATYARGPLSARVQSQIFLSRTFEGGDPRNDFRGYTVVDASLRYRTGFGDLVLSAANLLDEEYLSYASDTTRPTDNTFLFAGRGRTLTLGWDWRF